ncbi:MAG: hypothetical protein JO317_06265, partial [Verrucomicrobiae bacterium]|nr:hypothetical protein [Verrucomicrobiae bacterium]
QRIHAFALTCLSLALLAFISDLAVGRPVHTSLILALILVAVGLKVVRAELISAMARLSRD